MKWMPPPWRIFVPGLLGLAVLVTAVFAPVGGFDFVKWDDDINITGNPLLSADWSWETIGQMASADQAMRFKLVYWVTAKLIHTVAGYTPAVWHWVGLTWHVVATLLFAIVLRSGIRLTHPAAGIRADLCALFAALVWALHPLRVETVAWVTASTYPLTGVFLLASFACYLKSIPTGAYRIRWLIAAWVCAVLGYGSYPVGLTYGLWLIAFDVWMQKRGIAPDKPHAWGWWLKHGLFLLPAAAAMGITLWTRFNDPGIFSSAPDVESLGVVLRLVMALAGLAALAWRLIWPLELTPNLPPLDLGDNGTLGWVLTGMAVAVSCLYIAWRTRKTRPGLTLVIVGFMLMCIPVLGLTERPNWPVDRYSYIVHLILVGGGVAWLFRALAHRPAGLAVLLTLVVVIEAGATRSQLLIWRNTESLFTHMIEHPGFADNPRQQGHVYVLWARHLTTDNEPDRAADMYNHAQQVYLDAIKVALDRSDYVEALSVLSHQEHNFGLTPVLRREKGGWLLRLNRPVEALRELRKAIAELPDDLRTRELLEEAGQAAAGN